MLKSMYKKLILLSVFVIAIQAVSAHPFGLTISNLSYSKHKLLFSTRILYDDFRPEFQRTARTKGKNYVKQGFDKTDLKDLETYLHNNIHIYVDNKELKQNAIKFSFELHEDEVFIFIVELSFNANISKGSHIRIRDIVLLNTVKGQNNLINVYLKDPAIPSHGVITLDKDNPEYEFVND